MDYNKKLELEKLTKQYFLIASSHVNNSIDLSDKLKASIKGMSIQAE